ncbi:hypothetical protein [Actinoplanes sp. NPDC089786]|uniref:hypothetical protein n=1 Tax=Actinoplanes sp. NPDC089786 TaxID=3155185 RepID=UPI00343ED29B
MRRDQPWRRDPARNQQLLVDIERQSFLPGARLTIAVDPSSHRTRHVSLIPQHRS